MNDSFDHPYALLERGRFHIAELGHALADYGRSDAVTFFEEEVGDAHFMRLKFESPLPDVIPCIVYDAVSCLRTTLDYIVYAATVELTRDADIEFTKFPVGDDENGTKNQFKGWAKNVPAQLREILLKVEPWEHGVGHIIWEFNKVRNKGIHRKLIPLASHVQDHQFIPGPILVVGEMEPMQDWSDDRSTLTILRFHGWGEMRLGFRMGVAFDDPIYFSKADVAQKLTDVADAVERIAGDVKVKTAQILGNGP